MWLIFCFVILWTGFPEAYASVTLTLYVPLTLAALGIGGATALGGLAWAAARRRRA